MTYLLHLARFCDRALNGQVENAMATPVAPFCSNSYQFLASTIRVPGEERDEIKNYLKEKPTHGLVYR